MNYQRMSIGQIDEAPNLSRQVTTAEIESVLASHPKVSEVVVVPFTLEVGRQALSAFVTLKVGVAESDPLRIELANRLLEKIGPIVIPERIHFAPSLPKTRSGKIMRDILQEIAAG
jgi:acetyl-CoA synthetase